MVLAKATAGLQSLNSREWVRFQGSGFVWLDFQGAEAGPSRVRSRDAAALVLAAARVCRQCTVDVP